MEAVQIPHHDLIVASMTIANHNVNRILIDNGSSTNLLFYDIFCKMKLSLSILKKIHTSLIGFNESLAITEGEIPLLVTMGHCLDKQQFS